MKKLTVLEVIQSKLSMNLYTGQNKKDVEYLLEHIKSLKAAGDAMEKELDLVDDGGGFDSVFDWQEVTKDDNKIK